MDKYIYVIYIFYIDYFLVILWILGYLWIVYNIGISIMEVLVRGGLKVCV